MFPALICWFTQALDLPIFLAYAACVYTSCLISFFITMLSFLAKVRREFHPPDFTNIQKNHLLTNNLAIFLPISRLFSASNLSFAPFISFRHLSKNLICASKTALSSSGVKPSGWYCSGFFLLKIAFIVKNLEGFFQTPRG